MDTRLQQDVMGIVGFIYAMTAAVLMSANFECTLSSPDGHLDTAKLVQKIDEEFQDFIVEENQAEKDFIVEEIPVENEFPAVVVVEERNPIDSDSFQWEILKRKLIDGYKSVEPQYMSRNEILDAELEAKERRRKLEEGAQGGAEDGSATPDSRGGRNSRIASIEVEVDTLVADKPQTDQNRKKKTRNSKLKLKRGITVDSGSHHNVMPRRLVRKDRIK